MSTRPQDAPVVTEEAPPNEIEAMYVQVAASAESAPGTLTLQGLGPATLFFSDRPQRVVGHVTAPAFIELWTQGENSFAEDPPNAVLCFMEEGDRSPEDAVVVLRDPRLDGDAITYSVEILENTLPRQAGACSLFIDPIGRPLSPLSVAGVHRRARRRGRGL
jgi:hypothetical protein